MSIHKHVLFNGLTGCLVVAGFLLGAAPAGAQVKVSVEDGSVAVDAATPGGRVAIVGVEFQKPPWRWRIEPMAEVVSDDDGDGRVTVPLPAGPGRAAVVVAVDLAAGSDAVSTWQVLGGEAADLKSNWTDDEDGGGPVLRLACRSAIVLAVARNGRVTSAVLFDGSGLDADGLSDGFISIKGEALHPLGDDGVANGTPWEEGERVYAVSLERTAYARTKVPASATGLAGGAQ